MITNEIRFEQIAPSTDFASIERLQYENELLKECVRYYSMPSNWYADEVISYHTARECLENIGDDLLNN